jgi:hypothetical protein
VATVSTCGEDSNGEESDLSKVLASRRTNTNGFDSIDPTLRGLRASHNPTRKSYHQPIFTSGSQCAPFTDATSAAPDDESSAPTRSLNQVTLSSQASTGTQTQASASRAASQDDFQASTDTQAQALPPQPTPKWPKEHASGAAAPNPRFDPIIDGELTPHLSLAPKHPKQAAMMTADKPAKSAPRSGIRKST